MEGSYSGFHFVNILGTSSWGRSQPGRGRRGRGGQGRGRKGLRGEGRGVEQGRGCSRRGTVGIKEGRRGKVRWPRYGNEEAKEAPKLRVETGNERR